MQYKCACGKTLKVPDTMAGKQARCPGCGNVFTVPAANVPIAPPAGGKIFITCACGKRLAAPPGAVDRQVRCPGCGAAVPVPGAGTAESQTPDDNFELDLDPHSPTAPEPQDDAYAMSTPKCPNCHTELETGAQFCVSCGTHLATGAKQEELNLDKTRKQRKRQKVKRILGIVRVVVTIAVLVVVCWAGWAYIGKKKYHEWQKKTAATAGKKDPDQNKQPEPTQPATTPSPPADAPRNGGPASPETLPSPLRTPEKPGTLGHAPQKTGREGYLEIVVYQPSRTEDKLALNSVLKSLEYYKSLGRGLPNALMEAHKEYPFQPPPAGMEYVYDPADGKVGMRRLRDTQAPKNNSPELD